MVTPYSHENGKADGACIVEDVSEFRVEAIPPQVSVIAEVVTRGTHDRCTNSVLLANIVATSTQKCDKKSQQVNVIDKGPHPSQRKGRARY